MTPVYPKDFTVTVTFRDGVTRSYKACSEAIARDWFKGYRASAVVKQVTLYNPDGQVIAIDGVLNGRD